MLLRVDSRKPLGYYKENNLAMSAKSRKSLKTSKTRKLNLKFIQDWINLKIVRFLK
jgi:hypothetical protein